jgi:SAM-dependent methyltransferase
MAGAWDFDEAAHAGPEHLDPAYIAGYDRKAGTDPGDDVEVLRAAGVNEHSTVIDLGAGTGTFAAAMAPWCREVVAVDVSKPMLAALRARCEELGRPNVRGVEAGFLSYEHQGAPAAAVYSRNALHHLPDFWKSIALTRVAGLLAPGGVFRLRDLVYSFDPSDAAVVFER